MTTSAERKAAAKDRLIVDSEKHFSGDSKILTGLESEPL